MAEGDDGDRDGVGRWIAAEPPVELDEPGLVLAAEDGVDAESTEVQLVERGVETVCAEVGVRFELADPGDQALGEASGGVHRDEERDDRCATDRCVIERVDAHVVDVHVGAGASEHGSRRGQTDRLAAEIVGRHERHTMSHCVSLL